MRFGRAYTLTAHEKAIGTGIHHIIDYPTYWKDELEIFYVTKNLDDELLRVIRSDPRVMMVTYNSRDEQNDWAIESCETKEDFFKNLCAVKRYDFAIIA